MTHRLLPAATARKLLAVLGSAMLLLGAREAPAALIPLSFHDFYADPSVTVTPDGSAALMAEDPALSFVLLANDPFFGSPPIVAAGLGTRLLFDYVFAEAAGEDDQFRAFVFDSATGVTAAGLEFLTAEPGNGTVAFDLSGLVGLTLGMQFELASLFGDTGLGSSAGIANLRLETPEPIGVPEPSTLALWMAALLSSTVAARRRRPARHATGR